MRLVQKLRLLFACLLLTPALVLAADYDNPLAVIAANPQLSDMHRWIKKTGYAEPLAAGGDVTFLALSNKLLRETARGAPMTNLEFLRDKLPAEAQLLFMQALTLDGQYGPAQFDELLTAKGSGKAEVITILGKDAKYILHRGKDKDTFVLENAFHQGTLIKAGNEIVTQNGVVIVVDANTEVPK